MTSDHQDAHAEIRCGKFVATSNDHFALSFQIMQIRDGVPKPVCVHGAMPVIITRWDGAGFPMHVQSLQ
jgi:hypothetical protein